MKLFTSALDIILMVTTLKKLFTSCFPSAGDHFGVLRNLFLHMYIFFFYISVQYLVMGFCTDVLGITLIITNSKNVLEFMSHSSRGHFGVFWGLFWHISSNFLEPFNMFCEILCRRFWCSFWRSLHYFCHVMTVFGSLRGYLWTHFGQFLSNTL